MSAAALSVRYLSQLAAAWATLVPGSRYEQNRGEATRRQLGDDEGGNADGSEPHRPPELVVAMLLDRFARDELPERILPGRVTPEDLPVDRLQLEGEFALGVIDQRICLVDVVLGVVQRLAHQAHRGELLAGSVRGGRVGDERVQIRVAAEREQCRIRASEVVDDRVRALVVLVRLIPCRENLSRFGRERNLPGQRGGEVRVEHGHGRLRVSRGAAR